MNETVVYGAFLLQMTVEHAPETSHYMVGHLCVFYFRTPSTFLGNTIFLPVK